MGKKINKIRRSLSLWRVRNMFIWPAVFFGLEQINVRIFNFLFIDGEYGEWLAISGLAIFYLILFLIIFKTPVYKKIFKPIIVWLNKILTKLWTLVCRKRLVHFCVLISIFFLVYYLNLLNPIFNIATDIKIIGGAVPKFFVDAATKNSWTNLENNLQRQGELWCPPTAKPNKGMDDVSLTHRFDKWINSACQDYDVLHWVLFGVACQEGGRFANVPDLKGETSLGLTQIQSAFLGLKMTGRDKRFISKKHRGSVLEHERLRHLAMFCGIIIKDPTLNWFWSWIKYYLVGSIDDRLTGEVVNFTAKTLRQYYDYYSHTYPNRGEDAYWRAAIAAWPYGLGSEAWANRNSNLTNLYVEKGKMN